MTELFYVKIENSFKNKVSVYELYPEDIYTHINKIISWEKYNLKLELQELNKEERA